MRNMSLFLVVLFMGLLAFSGTTFAGEVERCTIPKGAVFTAIHKISGPAGVSVPKDTRIIIKSIQNSSNPTQKLRVAIFSLSVNKPTFVNKRGIFIYERYKHNLSTDDAYIVYDTLKDCEKSDK